MTRGDVYRLSRRLGEIPAGLYVVTEISLMLTLAATWCNEDGMLSATARQIKVTWDEWEENFIDIDVTIEV